MMQDRTVGADRKRHKIRVAEAFPPSPGTPLARDGHGFHCLEVLRTQLY